MNLQVLGSKVNLPQIPQLEVGSDLPVWQETDALPIFDPSVTRNGFSEPSETWSPEDVGLLYYLGFPGSPRESWNVRFV